MLDPSPRGSEGAGCQSATLKVAASGNVVVSGPAQPLALAHTKGAVVVTLIRGAAREGVGQDPRVTCNEKSRSPYSWK